VPAVSIPGMSAPEFPPGLVDLQKRSDAAWDAVEAHRKTVDAARRAAVPPESDPTRRWESPHLRPWTEGEDAEHGRLLAAAREAAESLRAGVLAAGLRLDYATTQGLKDAARA